MFAWLNLSNIFSHIRYVISAIPVLLTRTLSTAVAMKWNESGFRPPLCTYRLNWARRTSRGWWDDWDGTVLQTRDAKFTPRQTEAEHATSRSRRLPTILTFTRGWGRNIFVSFKPPRPGTEPRSLAWKAAVLTTTLGPPPSTVVARCGIELYCTLECGFHTLELSSATLLAATFKQLPACFSCLWESCPVHTPTIVKVNPAPFTWRWELWCLLCLCNGLELGDHSGHL